MRQFIRTPHILLIVALIFLVPHVVKSIRARVGGASVSRIAPFFTAQVQHWHDDILRWSKQYNIDPNLMATIMQIESCGHPTVASHAGAQGLFQVMPFHFSAGENMLDPDTNALRSANFINLCSSYANGDPGMTLACYNGGPSVISRPHTTWTAETQRYYTWGIRIYSDALNQLGQSPALNHWLQSGGVHLCNRASSVLHSYR